MDPKIGVRVVPHGNVPRVGQVGEVTAVLEIDGLLWCDVRFERPHAFHGSRMERIGADWLVTLDRVG